MTSSASASSKNQFWNSKKSPPRRSRRELNNFDRGGRVCRARSTLAGDYTARIWDVTWAMLIRNDALRERVCAEKLIGAAQEFSASEMEDPILRGIDKDDPIARNPCLRRGPLSIEYWTRLPPQIWRSTRKLVGVN
jgi:hypothetical protein